MSDHPIGVFGYPSAIAIGLGMAITNGVSMNGFEAGAPPGWRFRVSDYRVLYDIDDGKRAVTIRGAGHRRDVYRRR